MYYLCMYGRDQRWAGPCNSPQQAALDAFGLILGVTVEEAGKTAPHKLSKTKRDSIKTMLYAAHAGYCPAEFKRRVGNKSIYKWNCCVCHKSFERTFKAGVKIDVFTPGMCPLHNHEQGYKVHTYENGSCTYIWKCKSCTRQIIIYGRDMALDQQMECQRCTTTTHSATAKASESREPNL